MKLADAIALYVTRRQAAGEKFFGAASTLRAFSLCNKNRTLTSITPAQVQEFLNGPRTGPITWQNKYSVLRLFFEYWRLREKLLTVPMPPALPRHTSSFVPYIYSRSELRLLLDAIPRCQQSSSYTMSSKTFRNLLLFLYGTGMRVGEALGLRLTDVDLGGGVITVRGTKFYKSRLVPLGHNLHELLRSHLAIPARLSQSDQPVFQSLKNRAIDRQVVEKSFRRLRQLAGIHRDNSAYQPRIHDLRHTFAVHRLTQWYRDGADVQALLPALSTYLGHVELHSTQRYLTMTPELLEEANGRFQRYVYGGTDEQ